MAYFYRLIFCCFIGVLAWLPVSSFADSYNALPDLHVSSYNGNDPKAALDKYCSLYAPTATATAITVSPAGRTADATFITNCSNGQPNVQLYGAAVCLYGGLSNGLGVCVNAPACSSGQTRSASGQCTCPINSSGATCSCNAGFILSGSSCVSVLQATCNVLAGQTAYVTANGTLTPGQTVCGKDGCNVSMSSTVISYVSKVTGFRVSEGDAQITSTPCTYTDAAAATPLNAASAATVATPSTCKGGSVGAVNGIQTCIPYDPKLNTIETKSTSSSTSATAGPAGAASSAVSATSGTTCTGGSCVTSTTTTTTPGDGTAPTTKTDTKTDTKDQFCQDHPADPLCKKSDSSFNGSCGSPPVCSGDAVMCAVAAATFKSTCIMTTNDVLDLTTAENEFEAAKLKTGDQTKDMAGNISINLSSSSFDQTELLGSASGMTDLTVAVMGKSIVLPFSTVNPYLDNLGRILQAVTFLMCAVIVSGLRSRG